VSITGIGVVLPVTIGALAVGIIGNSVLRAHAKGEKTGVEIGTLVAPIGTLAVFLLAFLTAAAFTSYRGAVDATVQEAGALDGFAEQAALLHNAPLRTAINGELICYGQTVRYQEWPAMGSGHASPAVAVWTGRIRQTLFAIDRDGTDTSEVGPLLTLDRNLNDARRARLTNAAPTVPTALYAFLLTGVGVALFSLAMFTETGIRRSVQIPVLSVLAVLLLFMLLLIPDLDRPFSGLVSIKPTAIATEVQDLKAEYQQTSQQALPCDRHGNLIT
jgi:hypothetical protein